MASVIATDSTRCFSINSNISRAMPGSPGISPRLTFQSLRRNSAYACRSVVHRGDAEFPVVIKRKDAEISFAKTCTVRQDGL